MLYLIQKGSAMNEMDILDLFYDQMKAFGVSHRTITISINEQTAKLLSLKLGVDVTVAEARKFTDICLANEWLERTTIDPAYNFLSLTDAGVKVILSHKYPNV